MSFERNHISDMTYIANGVFVAYHIWRNLESEAKRRKMNTAPIQSVMVMMALEAAETWADLPTGQLWVDVMDQRQGGQRIEAKSMFLMPETMAKLEAFTARERVAQPMALSMLMELGVRLSVGMPAQREHLYYFNLQKETLTV